MKSVFKKYVCTTEVLEEHTSALCVYFETINEAQCWFLIYFWI